jgi:hypothetical protein
MLREHESLAYRLSGYAKVTIGGRLLGAAGSPKPASGSYIDS